MKSSRPRGKRASFARRCTQNDAETMPLQTAGTRGGQRSLQPGVSDPSEANVRCVCVFDSTNTNRMCVCVCVCVESEQTKFGARRE